LASVHVNVLRVEFFTVRLPEWGRLATMARPSETRLSQELTALRTAGFDVLVCALPLPELHELGLDDEPNAARAAGLRFSHLPIQDFGTPDLRLVPNLAELAGSYREGANLAVHCRGGIGRSSLIAAAILVLSGVDPDSAWKTIATARRRPVPETDEQREWIYQLSSGANHR
jgi:protein-tyrosine phosphatase